MKTVYFSDLLNKTFESEDECKKAEAVYLEKKAKTEKADEERKADAKKVEDAYKAYLAKEEEAQKAYQEFDKLLEEFTKKYKKFHMTVTGPCKTVSLFDTFMDLAEAMANLI